MGGQPPRSPKTPTKLVLPGRTQSLPSPPPVSALTAGLALAAAGAAGGRSEPIGVPVGRRREGSIGESSVGLGISTMSLEGPGGGAGGDSEESSSVVTTASSSLLLQSTGGNGNFTPGSSLGMEVAVAERFMSLRVQGQGGEGGTTVVELLQGEAHLHEHVRFSSAGQEGQGAPRRQAGAASSSSAGSDGANDGEGEGEGEGGAMQRKESVSSLATSSSAASSPAPVPAPLSTTPPLTRFAVGRRLR